MTRCVWTIGGSDPSGAAGIQADLKTCQSLGVHGATALTAVTAQGLSAFRSLQAMSSLRLDDQLEALALDLPPSAIKVGMLATKENVERLAIWLDRFRVPTVVDPVLWSSSGATLIEPEGIDLLVRKIFPMATIVTPNIPEAERLTGLAIRSDLDMERATEAILALGAPRVLLKGGHSTFDGEAAVRDLYRDGTQMFWLSSPRHEAKVRGTGCAFASATAAMLARGEDIQDAVVAARAYVARGIRESKARATSPSLFAHSPWPPSASDFPLASRHATTSSFDFPSTGPTPLGFYPIVDRADWIDRLVKIGTKTIQLRCKDLQGDALRNEVERSIAICRAAGTRLFINDHWRLAIELDAYGVHLGQEDLEEADLSAIAQAGLRLGISTHSYHEAAVAKGIAPSYVALGPIFATTCKSMRFGPQGLARISEWCSLFDQPLVAIGGLTRAHARQARKLGADGVAVISDVTRAIDPEASAREWMSELKEDLSC